MRILTVGQRVIVSIAAIALTAMLTACEALDTQASSTPLPESCQTDCVTPYGQVLGIAPGNVAAYSNCNAKCVVFSPNREQATYTEPPREFRRLVVVSHAAMADSVSWR